MAVFSMEIAGCVIQVHSLFESTRDYCHKYLSTEPPDISVTVTEDMLDFEQQALDDEADREGLRRRVFTRPFLERTAIQRQVAEALLYRDVLLIHGSAVAVDGRGYLFTAKTGTGKSTHTRLWRQVFGSRAEMINDDKPFVRMGNEGVFLCGAPWSGKHGLDHNLTVPLQGICILERGTENRIYALSGQDAAGFLAHQCQLPRKEVDIPRFHALLQQLLQAVPVYRMACTISQEAAIVAHNAMS